MESISDTIKLGKRNFTSVLISGGMNNKGYVPLDEHEDEKPPEHSARLLVERERIPVATERQQDIDNAGEY